MSRGLPRTEKELLKEQISPAAIGITPVMQAELLDRMLSVDSIAEWQIRLLHRSHLIQRDYSSWVELLEPWFLTSSGDHLESLWAMILQSPTQMRHGTLIRYHMVNFFKK